MWLFRFSLKSGYVTTVAIEDGPESDQMFRDFQSWIHEPEKTTTPKGITVKSLDGKYVMLNVSQLAAVEIEKMDDDQYKLKYGTM